MIKKIAVNDIRVGMYIHDLNCGWMDHGFLRNQFPVRSESSIEQIKRAGVRELYIDTEKGCDLPSAPTEAEVTAGLEAELACAAEQSSERMSETPLAEERVQAKRIQSEALRIVTGLMEDVRLGQQIDLERARPLVGEMVGSIFRNKSALMGLARIRHMDRYTFEHSVNVAVLMVSFARALELEPAVIQEIGVGALLHDIGKTRTPHEILNKPGRLSDEEFAIMRGHVVHSREILRSAPGISATALAVAAEHHERVDGSGYPEGKDGAKISLYGRMAAIVDVYDAITSDRVYHKGMEPHQALRKMLEWSRHHFDPELVQHFIRCVGIYPVGSLVMLQSGRLAVVVESGRTSPAQPVVRVVMDARHRRYLSVEDVDLARKGRGGEDRITGAESPERWGIDCAAILQLPI